MGWQAKFLFDINGLIKQASASLATALSVHNDLVEYVVCFPFDPTGKTARKGKRGPAPKSETEKLNAWIERSVTNASKAGRNLKVKLWPESRLLAILLENDSSGGIRNYFFNEKPLSSSWFHDHVESAVFKAGPTVPRRN